MNADVFVTEKAFLAVCAKRDVLARELAEERRRHEALRQQARIAYGYVAGLAACYPSAAIVAADLHAALAGEIR